MDLLFHSVLCAVEWIASLKINDISVHLTAVCQVRTGLALKVRVRRLELESARNIYLNCQDIYCSGFY
jgi:hypothetical protein